MWRQNAFQEHPCSDQSISDEDDFDGDFPKNCVPLGEIAKEEESLLLPLQLEILKGTHELNCGRNSSHLVNEQRSLEEDIEIPNFHNEGNFICSPRKEFTFNLEEEIISDDEENNLPSNVSINPGPGKFEKAYVHNFGSKNQYEADAWFAATKEAEALIRINENDGYSSSHSAYSKAKKSCKGVRGKGKPKFQFRFRSHKEGLSLPSTSNDENDVSSNVNEVPEREPIEHKTVAHSIAELLADFQGGKKKHYEVGPAEAEVFRDGFVEHSIADLLDGLHDKTSLLSGNSKMNGKTRGKRIQLAVKRSVSTLRTRNIDNEDPPEPLGSGSSSDDEATYQNLKHDIPERKKKTMADRFQEVLGAASLSEEGSLFTAPRPLGVGIFSNLQMVMQSEKERDMEFLKKLQTGASPNNEPGCIDVKILSRYLDAKLTVCQCSFFENIESPQWPRSPHTAIKNGGTKITVIFNPRVCSDVELEVGNLICIHTPWKEVHVTGDDKRVILATYFSYGLICPEKHALLPEQ